MREDLKAVKNEPTTRPPEGDSGGLSVGKGGHSSCVSKFCDCLLEAQRAAFTLAQANGLGWLACGLRPGGPRYATEVFYRGPSGRNGSPSFTQALSLG